MSTESDVKLLEPTITFSFGHKFAQDLTNLGRAISVPEARYLVDAYYQIQRTRIRFGNQAWAMEKTKEPNALISWLANGMEYQESIIRRVLDKFSDQIVVGRWAKSITGVGPVISAGLLAHLPIRGTEKTKKPFTTVGKVWRMAGLDPTLVWERGKPRPWNAGLKRLCWCIGESFVKVSSNPKDIYGKVWMKRKEIEWARNKAGNFSDQAVKQLQQAAKYNVQINPDVKVWLTGSMSAEAVENYEKTENKRLGLAKKLSGEPGSGVQMLAPGRIHSRAKRYAVKLFLAHYHHVAWESEYGYEPVKPYVITQVGHTTFIGPPNWPMDQPVVR